MQSFCGSLQMETCGHGYDLGWSAGEAGEAKGPVHEELTELQRLRGMVDEITEATNLAPVGSAVVNADGAVVGNPLFSGVQYPDKLEAYYHIHQGPKGMKAQGMCGVKLLCWNSAGQSFLKHAGGTAADDVRGCWSILHDKFRQSTVCRNLLFLGYTFYYSSANKTWGGFYNGDGLKNNDLIFML